MHLLAAQPGAIDDGQEPVDPGQTPAEVIFISAADTELVCLSEARSALQESDRKTTPDDEGPSQKHANCRKPTESIHLPTV